MRSKKSTFNLTNFEAWELKQTFLLGRGTTFFNNLKWTIEECVLQRKREKIDHAIKQNQ